MSNRGNLWFHSARPVKFFMVDYRASLFFILFLLNISFKTFALLIFVFVVFYILEANKINVVDVFKKIRFKLGGKTRQVK
jgi:hypothetical protein